MSLKKDSGDVLPKEILEFALEEVEQNPTNGEPPLSEDFRKHMVRCVKTSNPDFTPAEERSIFAMSTGFIHYLTAMIDFCRKDPTTTTASNTVNPGTSLASATAVKMRQPRDNERSEPKFKINRPIRSTLIFPAGNINPGFKIMSEGNAFNECDSFTDYLRRVIEFCMTPSPPGPTNQEPGLQPHEEPPLNYQFRKHMVICGKECNPHFTPAKEKSVCKNSTGVIQYLSGIMDCCQKDLTTTTASNTVNPGTSLASATAVKKRQPRDNERSEPKFKINRSIRSTVIFLAGDINPDSFDIMSEETAYNECDSFTDYLRRVIEFCKETSPPGPTNQEPSKEEPQPQSIFLFLNPGRE